MPVETRIQEASPGAAPRLSRNVLLIADKAVMSVEELERPYTELMRIPTKPIGSEVDDS